MIKKWQWRRVCYSKHYPPLHSLLFTNIPVRITICRTIYTPIIINVTINIHIYYSQVDVHFAMVCATNESWRTADLCDAFVYSKGSVGMRLLSGSMPAPSKMMLMGPLLRSTISHLWQRELQPSICAVSQLECWFHAFS